MTETDSALLRRIYTEVCRGYTQSVFNGQSVYIKHLSVFDQTDIDDYYKIVLDEIITRKIPTEEQRKAFLESKKLWTKKDDFDIQQEKNYLDNLRRTRAKAALKLQANQLDKQIEEANIKINKLIFKRDNLIGLTAEKVADQKTQYEYIRLSFYKDKDFKYPLFDKNDIYNLNEDECEQLLTKYIESVERFSHKNLKKISIQDFFTNYFYLCGDDIYNFFQKPIVNLTNYQVNLLHYGKYFKSILTNHEIPRDLLDDPDKIEDFVGRATNAKNVIEKASVSKGGRVGIVGATAEDFAALGVQDGTNEIRDIAKKEYKTGREGAQNLGFSYND